jgi:lantibiotic biosynthesis protein
MGIQLTVENLNHLLSEIDKLILNKSSSEPLGLISGLGGCSLYFSKRYFQTRRLAFQNYSVEMLEKILDQTNERALPTFLSIGTPEIASCWLIDQYVRHGLLNEGEKINSKIIIDSIVQSISMDELNNNNHDLFYGFIGKAIILMENDKQNNKESIDRIIQSLINNRVKDSFGVHWKTPFPFYQSFKYEETVNFGIPHGCIGIILFLINCSVSLNLKGELKPTLDNSIDWLIHKLDNEQNLLHHIYGNAGGGMGRLAWCYGDLVLALVLLRYDEVASNKRSRKKAYELIAQASSKSIQESGVRYYKEYDFYDVGLCHGTSSIAYMYEKMYQITSDLNIKSLADQWLAITIENLNKFLSHFDEISKSENKDIDYTMGFLEGLSGVGLVLISFLNPKLSDWDKLLLLDRPEKE